MKVIEYDYSLKNANANNLAVALGYFDGVHSGHRILLSELVKKAKVMHLLPTVLTFNEDLAKSKKTKTIIYNNDDKIKIFEELGIELVILADFASIANLPPEQFVKDVLIDTFDTRLAIAGYNFRFGKNASAGASELCTFMSKHEREAIIIDEQSVSGTAVSATGIRALISDRKIKDANLLLGIPYFIHGTVERGLGLGKAYGFPTVNTPIREDSPLVPGVYRSAVRIRNKLYTGITNIGSCPTVKEREIHAETLIADFSGDLYGEEIFIYLLDYLREEKRFDSIDELRRQIYLDRDKSIKENGDLKWLATGLSLP